MRGGGTRLVVLDRDGVINEDSGEFIKSVGEWRPIPGSLEAIALLHRRGFKVVVVTNQSGVGRRLFTEETLHDIHRHMRTAVENAGGLITAIYYCPHLPDAGCDCRKPRTGMLRRLQAELGVSLVDAPFVGDRPSDVEAARTVGARPILVRTGTGMATERQLGDRDLEVFADLRDAAEAIAGGRR
jgi:D-glycero-D-manno-heptose 1,7-bisphosphate phosphatase